MAEESDGFEAATGDGPGSAAEPRAREAEVRTAFEGLLQIRRLTYSGPGDPASVLEPPGSDGSRCAPWR